MGLASSACKREDDGRGNVYQTVRSGRRDEWHLLMLCSLVAGYGAACTPDDALDTIRKAMTAAMYVRSFDTEEGGACDGEHDSVPSEVSRCRATARGGWFVGRGHNCFNGTGKFVAKRGGHGSFPR